MVNKMGMLRLAGVAALTLAAGCAPGFGPGVQIGVTPGGSLNVGTASCSALGISSHTSAYSSSAQISGRYTQIRAIQARVLRLAQTPQPVMEHWKSAASGGC